MDGSHSNNVQNAHHVYQSRHEAPRVVACHLGNVSTLCLPRFGCGGLGKGGLNPEQPGASLQESGLQQQLCLLGLHIQPGVWTLQQATRSTKTGLQLRITACQLCSTPHSHLTCLISCVGMQAPHIKVSPSSRRPCLIGRLPCGLVANGCQRLVDEKSLCFSEQTE